MTTVPAILALADGTLFKGVAIGANGHTVGEVVFNTAITGYQEILTDPSYTRQIVTLTYPHIGNVGANSEDTESGAVFASGLIIRDLPLLHSNFRAEDSLSDYLKKNNVVAIADIDTRKLTRILREKGAQAGCIMAGDIDEARAVELARGFGSMAGQDLAQGRKLRGILSAGIPARMALGPGLYRPDRNTVSTWLPMISACEAQHPAHAGRAGLQTDRRSGSRPRPKRCWH